VRFGRGGKGRRGKGGGAEKHAERQQRHRSGAQDLHAGESNLWRTRWQEDHCGEATWRDSAENVGILAIADTRFHRKIQGRYQFCSSVRLLLGAE
jgi:hypothetical protein